MKKHFLSKLLTILLITSMILTMLPVSAMAYYGGNWNSLWESIWGGSDDETAGEAANAAEVKYEYNIFFLDCGRKYFSVENIEKMIDNAAAAGFNYIQLAVGNDGLRLLLDEMSLEVNGTTYDSEAVKAAIHAGNEAYYNFSTDELTQSEMDDIIAYANTKGVGVIPCVNTPGHMDAILSAATSLTGTDCSYNGSARTIDVTNDTAVAFTKALLQKYIDYFAGKGCKLFNMGADEYANDKYTGGSMGFGNLQDTGKYHYYVTYVNAVAAMIKDAGMTPMAFNDGIYFNSNTSSGTFDTDIIICYWSNGWSSYSPMPAATLASKGFKLVNTNGDYYWVLGKTDAQCSASKASGFNYKSFPGSTIDAPAGSMFCIWADYPGAETEADVVSKTADTIKAFGGALPVLTPSQPDTGITITPSKPSTGGASNTVTMGEQMTLTANEKVYWRWNSEVVELTSADPVETVSMAALYAEQSLYAQSVNVKPLKAGDAGITVAADETGTPQPYSLTVVNSSATTGETVKLKVGAAYTVKVDGANYAGEYSTENPAVATVTVTGQNAVKTETTYDSVGDLTLSTIVGNRTGYWYQKTDYWYHPANADSGVYYPVYATYWGNKYYVGYSATDNYLRVTKLKNGEASLTVNVYTRSEGVDKPASTTITFHGEGEGTTYVTIGGTKYTINVSYNEQPVNVVLDRSTQVTVSGALNKKELNESVATVSISTDGTTMTVTGVAEGNTSVIVGNTKYLITVSTEDLEAVNPLKIEYWITNGPVQRSENDTTNYFTISAAMNGIATPNGVEVTANTMIPKEGYKKDGGRTVYYWHCRLLDTSVTNTYGDKTQKQTDKNGDDETDSGVAFTKIRYYNGNWEVFTEKSAWVKVEEKHQLVAYYKEYLKVTDEVESYAADWGNKGDGAPGGWLNSSEYCTLSIQVIYEDGTTNPTETTAAALTAKSFVYGYWSDNKGRGIGTVILNGTSDYEIVRVSAETGEASISLGANNATKITSLSWDNNEMTVWQGDNGSDEAVLHNPSNNFETDGTYANLAWDENKEAILLRVYVRAKVTEDSLTVNYYDESNLAKPFYNYNIAVANGTYFNSNIALNNPWKGNLKNGTVTNIKGVDQTVSADLSTMPAIGANYRYMEYNCTRVEPIKDESGHVKTVNLYYTFTNKVTFVADFGLPIRIPLTEINDTLKNATITGVTVLGAEYGTVNADTSSITYTPTKVFGADAEALQVSVKGQITVEGESGSTLQKSEVTYQVYILPASNVLYEENFLRAADGSGWTKAGSAPTTAQETQKVGVDGSYEVFGYDKAYVKNGAQNVIGQLGVWTASGLQYSKSTGVMTTEFYGNGFDLIGSCGKNTGRILLGIFKGNEKRPVATRIIDTKFDDASVAEMLYQVPLAHVMLKEAAQYRVEIYASGVKEQTNNARANSRSVSAAAYSYDDYADGFASILDSYGVRMSDVEYIRFADIADSASAAATMSLRPVALADEGGAGSCSVEIDSFRVYRSGSDATYPANEQDVTYVNVLDRFTNGGFTAFVENGNGDGKWAKREDYESNGGPQNEIYLRKSDGTATGDAVAFNVGANQTVQISARAVETGKTAKMVVNGGTPVETEISSNTEMYYEVKADNNGIITIKNTGEAMLALGNLKVKSTQTVAELSDEQIPMAIALLSMAPAPEEPEQPAAFTPEHFDAKVSATGLGRSKIVRLTVTTSSDVAKLTVNGKELRPVNGWLVKMGWSSSYTYILSEKMPRNDSRPFEIVCYNADGVASAAHVVTGQ